MDGGRLITNRGTTPTTEEVVRGDGIMGWSLIAKTRWSSAFPHNRPRSKNNSFVMDDLRSSGSFTLETRQMLTADVGALDTRQTYGVDGSGLSAAVVDTGVNYNHSAFGGQYGGNGAVVGGWDFAQNDADPNATGWQHGTAVAGVIASREPSALGVAPGADIVALRVFDDQNQSTFKRIADTLQWVVDHHQDYDISVVNLSISDTRNYSADYYSNDNGIGQRISELVAKLRELKIPVVTAAGNSFDGQHQGMGFTAIVSNTISVTAVDANDRLLGNAQRLGVQLGGAAATDLAAPGQGLRAPTATGVLESVEGTSFSAPMVSGAILLLQQIHQSRFGTLPSVDDLERWLENGSDIVHDHVTGINIPRLNVSKAAALIPTPPPPAPAPTPTPTPAPTPAPAPTNDLPNVNISSWNLVNSSPLQLQTQTKAAQQTSAADRLASFSNRASASNLFAQTTTKRLLNRLFKPSPLRNTLGNYSVQKWGSNA